MGQPLKGYYDEEWSKCKRVTSLGDTTQRYERYSAVSHGRLTEKCVCGSNFGVIFKVRSTEVSNECLEPGNSMDLGVFSSMKNDDKIETIPNILIFSLH